MIACVFNDADFLRIYKLLTIREIGIYLDVFYSAYDISTYNTVLHVKKYKPFVCQFCCIKQEIKFCFDGFDVYAGSACFAARLCP